MIDSSVNMVILKINISTDCTILFVMKMRTVLKENFIFDSLVIIQSRIYTDEKNK